MADILLYFIGKYLTDSVLYLSFCLSSIYIFYWLVIKEHLDEIKSIKDDIKELQEKTNLMLNELKTSVKNLQENVDDGSNINKDIKIVLDKLSNDISNIRFVVDKLIGSMLEKSLNK